MTGTFGSLNIAKTGIQYQQIVLDTASNNISNVDTPGYVRRSVVGGELGASAVGAMWSTSAPGSNGGVEVDNVERLSDQLLDTRVRREHGTLSSLLTQQTALSNVEDAINEPSDTGLSAALADFRSSLQDLATSPDVPATRAAVLSKANTLTQVIRSQAQSLADEQGDLDAQAATDVTQINADAQQLAQLNHSIFLGQASGVDVGTLLDQRDQVALDLANRGGAVSTQETDGRMTVTIGGQKLVEGDTAYAVSTDTSDASKYQITDPSDGTVKASGLTFTSGEMGGIAAATASLNDYSTSLNGVAQQLASAVNTAQAAGYDANGTLGADANPAFFVADPTSSDPSTITAANIMVALTDGSQIAASATATPASSDPSAPAGNYDGTNADAMWKATAAVGDTYQQAVTKLGAQVAGLNSNVTSQQALATQADDAREQLTGVSIDEETVNMVAAQHAYEASSRVLTVMDSILDTLINHTGVTA